MENNARKRILSPTNDRIFKLLMTSPGLKPSLMDMIAGIIREPVLAVEVRNNELAKDDILDKQERLDVNCVTGDGRQINMEMQASPMKEAGGGRSNLKNRSVYYLCDLYSTQSIKGKNYDSLARTWQVTFCTYTVFPRREDYVNEFTLRNNDGEALSDAVTVVFVELSKLKKTLLKPVGQMSVLEKWSVFINYAGKEKYREIVRQVVESREEIKMAYETLIHVSQEERERAKNRSRRMWQTDYESDMYTSRENGRAEGEEAKAIQIAKRLLKSGMSETDIADAVGLPADRIAELSEINHAHR